jgi:hypothetical protein
MTQPEPSRKVRTTQLDSFNSVGASDEITREHSRQTRILRTIVYRSMRSVEKYIMRTALNFAWHVLMMGFCFFLGHEGAQQH